MTASHHALVPDLVALVGSSHVLTDADVVAAFSTDITGRYGHPPLAVVRPADTSEVAGVLRYCHHHRVPVAVQGGNTGLVGGAVPFGDEVLLSLGRLTSVLPVDVFGASVTVGAGAVLRTVQRHVAAAGFEMPVDHGGRDGATIGGMVATDAGGINVVRHGTMRRHVRGLEYVLASGAVVDGLTGPEKDNTGLDLNSLLIGSEGTLAVITGVRMGLVPAARHRIAVLMGVSSPHAAVEAIGTLRRTLSSIDALEFWRDQEMELVTRIGNLPSSPVMPHPGYLLLQCATATDPSVELSEALATAGVDLASVAVGDSASSIERLWRYREAIPDTLNAWSPIKMDIGVAVRHVPELIRRVEATAERSPSVDLYLFGHLGEGNVHVNLVGLGAEEAASIVIEHVLDLDGAISAEHGLGVAKARYLDRARSNDEVRLMRRVKRLFDPHGILNRRRMFHDEPSGEAPSLRLS